MTNAEHIIAWIESSRPHYDRLLTMHDTPYATVGQYRCAVNLVCDAVNEACHSGDMYRSDVTADSLADAVKLALAWELES